MGCIQCTNVFVIEFCLFEERHNVQTNVDLQLAYGTIKKLSSLTCIRPKIYYCLCKIL